MGPGQILLLLLSVEKGSPLQGVARTDLGRKLCSIGNEIQWQNGEARLPASLTVLGRKKKKNQREVTINGRGPLETTDHVAIRKTSVKSTVELW